MSMIFYAVCLDCKKYIDLDKFYCCPLGYIDSTTDEYGKHIKDTDIMLYEFINDAYLSRREIYSVKLLLVFMVRHSKHRLTLANEDSFDEININEDYQQEYSYTQRMLSKENVI